MWVKPTLSRRRDDVKVLTSRFGSPREYPELELPGAVGMSEIER